MTQLPFAVQCQLCRHQTKDPSGRCHDHRNINGNAVRKLSFGAGLTPKNMVIQNGGNSADLYLAASSIQSDIESGSVYELDMTDGYGEEFDEIISISDAEKPNEGMLAFNTSRGATIYFSPEEFVDIRVKDSPALV